jgi:hypothetical protein
LIYNSGAIKYINSSLVIAEDDRFRRGNSAADQILQNDGITGQKSGDRRVNEGGGSFGDRPGSEAVGGDEIEGLAGADTDIAADY